MASYRKTFVIIALAVAPLSAFAQMGDFLSVSAIFTGGTFASISVDQQALDSDQVRVYPSGSYEMRLYEGTALISNNFFEAAVGDMETLGTAGQDSTEPAYGTFESDSRIVLVDLPLKRTISGDSAHIQILQNGKVLLDKPLSDLSVNVTSANANYLVFQTPEPSFPPYPPIPGNGLGFRTILLWSPLLLVPLALAGLWLVARKRRLTLSPSTENSPPNNIPPSSLPQ